MYVSWCIVMCYSCKIIILYDQFQVVQVIWYQSDSDFRMSWMKSTVIENTKYICNPLSRHLIMHYPIIWWFDGSLGKSHLCEIDLWKGTIVWSFAILNVRMDLGELW